MENQKYFFSYSRQNTDFVQQLATNLKNAGASVWLDQLDIPAGENWDVAIQKALSEAWGVLLVLSPASVQSENVLDEASFALDQGKRIIPLMIEPCTVPFRFARKQYIDFTTDYNTGFQNLLKALAEKGAAPQSAVKENPGLTGKQAKWSSAKSTFWSTTSAKLGVVSALLGIVLSGVAAFRIFSPDETTRTTEKSAILENKELEPKIEASYVSIYEEIYYGLNDSARAKGLYFLDYPLLKNEIVYENDEGVMEKTESFEDSGYTRTNYLILQNIGKVTPQDFQVVLKRYVIRDKVTIEETPGAASVDYAAMVRAKSTDSSVRTFSPPTPLETGKGLRIPLFISGHYPENRSNGKRAWNFLSKIVYLPDKVVYTDPLDEKRKEVKIRAMKDPVKLATGVEGRG